MHSPAEIRILQTSADLFRAAADEFSWLANDAVRERGRFCVALSGGSTPKGLYTFLAFGAIPIPWGNIFFFFGDERHVPPDDSESNYRMANEAMLSKVPIPPQNIFRVPAEGKDSQSVASAYQETLIKVFGLNSGEFPRFDLVHLGLGPDGHTASLFPGSSALQQKQQVFVANWVEQFHADRFTLTLPAINHSAEIVFLVSGRDKSGILRQVLEGDHDRFPAQLIRPENGKLLWMLDQPAASELSVSLQP